MSLLLILFIGCWIKVYQKNVSFSVLLEVIHLLSNTVMWAGMYICGNRFTAGYILSVGYASGKCYLHLQDKMSGRVQKCLKEHCFYQYCLRDRVAWLSVPL